MALLASPFARRTRAAAIYESTEIAIPRGATHCRIRIPRPNPWPDLGGGGKSDTHEFGLGGTLAGWYGGLETQVLRLYVWHRVNEIWRPGGHLGTQGGVLTPLRGDPETAYYSALPEGCDRLRISIDARERIDFGVEVHVDDRPKSKIVSRDAHHSIAVESTASGQATGASSVSSSANISPAGSDRYLVLGGANADDAGIGDYSDLDFGGVSGAQVFSVVDVNGINRLSAAEITAPSTTPATCTYTIANADDTLAVGAVAFSGVDQTTPRTNLSALAEGATSAPSVTKPGSSAGDVQIALMFGVSFAGGAPSPAGPGETARVMEFDAAAVQEAFGIMTKESGSDDLDYDGATSDVFGLDSWMMRAWNVNQAAAGGVTIIPGGLQVMGRGFSGHIAGRTGGAIE